MIRSAPFALGGLGDFGDDGSHVFYGVGELVQTIGNLALVSGVLFNILGKAYQSIHRGANFVGYAGEIIAFRLGNLLGDGKLLLGALQFHLTLLLGGEIHEGDDTAQNLVFGGAVGGDPHEENLVFARGYFPLVGNKGFKHILAYLRYIHSGEMVGNELQGTAYIVIHDGKFGGDIIGVSADIELIIHKDNPD